MNSKEARELTIASARKLPKYEQEREAVRTAIDDAARSGRCWVNLSFLDITNEAIMEELREDGFEVTLFEGELFEVHW